MIYIVQNALPILAATAAGLVAGLLWLTLTRAGGGSRLTAGFVVTALLAQAWLAAILAGALILAPVKADPWTIAVGTAVIIWIGFILPASIVVLRWLGTRWRDVALLAAHWLVVMVTQALVLRLIGLTQPPAA